MLHPSRRGPDPPRMLHPSRRGPGPPRTSSPFPPRTTTHVFTLPCTCRSPLMRPHWARPSSPPRRRSSCWTTRWVSGGLDPVVCRKVHRSVMFLRRIDIITCRPLPLPPLLPLPKPLTSSPLLRCPPRFPSSMHGQSEQQPEARGCQRSHPPPRLPPFFLAGNGAPRSPSTPPAPDVNPPCPRRQIPPSPSPCRPWAR